MLNGKTAIEFTHDILGSVVLRPNTVEVAAGEGNTKRVIRYFAGKGDGRKSSPGVRINAEAFGMLVGTELTIGNESTILRHKVAREEGDKGKVSTGAYRDRLADNSVVIDHDGEDVRVTLSAIREYNPTSGELRPDYTLTVDGAIVVKGSGGQGRTAAPAKGADALGGLFG